MAADHFEHGHDACLGLCECGGLGPGARSTQCVVHARRTTARRNRGDRDQRRRSRRVARQHRFARIVSHGRDYLQRGARRCTRRPAKARRWSVCGSPEWQSVDERSVSRSAARSQLEFGSHHPGLHSAAGPAGHSEGDGACQPEPGPDHSRPTTAPDQAVVPTFRCGRTRHACRTGAQIAPGSNITCCICSPANPRRRSGHSTTRRYGEQNCHCLQACRCIAGPDAGGLVAWESGRFHQRQCQSPESRRDPVGAGRFAGTHGNSGRSVSHRPGAKQRFRRLPPSPCRERAHPTHRGNRAAGVRQIAGQCRGAERIGCVPRQAQDFAG